MQEHQRVRRTIRQLRGGQVTIPVEFRKRLGITEDSVLEVTLDGEELRIRPLRLGETASGSAWLKELYEQFAAVREEAAKLSEEEVDVTIDQALAAARQQGA